MSVEALRELFVLGAGAARASNAAVAVRRMLEEAAEEPELKVPDGVFVTFVAQRFKASRATFEELRLKDLRLVCAALLGLDPAVMSIRKLVQKAVAHVAAQRRTDVESQALERLLVGPPPRLLEYEGRGPLAVWLKMVVKRLEIDLTRHAARQAELVSPNGGAWSSVVQSNPELKLMRATSKRQLEKALAEAHAALSDRDRMLLRLHYLQGVAHGELGKQLGVPRSTVAHHLARARERLLLDLHRRLKEELMLTTSDIKGIIGLVSGNIELTFLSSASSGSR